MNMRLTNLICLLLIVACAVLSGCAGGGTIGTGDTRSVSFSGRVVSSSGNAVEHAEVTVLESGDMAFTDNSGLFQIDSQLEGDSAVLSIRTVDVVGEVTLSEIPAEDSVVTLEIQADEITGGIVVLQIEVIPRDSAVSPTPVPGSPTPVTPAVDEHDGKSLIEGVLFFEDDVPVRAALISFNAGGDRVRTNAKGKFSIEFPSFSGASRLSIQYKNLYSTVPLKGFQGDDVIVTLKLKLPVSSTDNDVVLPSSVQTAIEEKDVKSR